ncbi:MAG: RHS repeat-associated core domain-containing protein, partial [Anaeroplasmataceae bacterium]|nr:RHS repeat-associated core domain-containing protein [Anaeroplasmataceae bacterium]
RTVDSIIMETYRHDNCNRIKELNRRTYEPDGVTQKLKKSPTVSNNPDAVASYIGETSYYGYDRSGNLLSDGNATYTYDGFGRTAEVKMANGNSQINRYDAEGLRAEMEKNGQLVKFKFNGEQYDSVISQYYLRARYYNPVMGRFTQEDTYYGDGLNLYEYCRNNPVLYRDPSGHDVVNQGNLYKNGKYSEAEII